MIAVVQRVSEASVKVDDNEISRIGRGILLLLGISKDDTDKDIEYLVRKCANLRIFSDPEGNLNLSLIDIGGEALIVSQFTLLGDTRKGRRPSFSNAMPPDKAKPMYEKFIDSFKRTGIHVKEGIFGAMMQITLTNDGPVTLIINSKDKKL